MGKHILSNSHYVVGSPALVETALSGVTALPASGSFINVSGYEWVHILLFTGTIHNSDTPVFTPKCSDSASGTADTIDSTLAYTPTPASDDGDYATWSIEVAKLPDDHHFVTMGISGTLTNGSYAHLVYLLEARHQPVTQSTTYLPSANQFTWCG